MKKCLVFTLILTTIFPAYCFATPQRIIPPEDEILDEIMLIIEDGIVEDEEVASFIGKAFFDEITVARDGECLLFLGVVTMIIRLLAQLDFSGSIGEILLDGIMLYAGLRLLLLLLLLSFELMWCP